MLKYLLLLVALLTTPVYAQNIKSVSIDCSAYTAMSAPQIVQDACFSSEVKPEKIKEWAGLSKDFSKAIIETAKDLGTTVNDFLYTPVGMLVAFYFLWDLIGGILVGIPLLVCLWIFYFKISKLLASDYHEVEYNFVPYLFGLVTIKRKTKEIWQPDQDGSIPYVLCGIVAIILSIIILAALIF